VTLTEVETSHFSGGVQTAGAIVSPTEESKLLANLLAKGFNGLRLKNRRNSSIKLHH